MLATHPGVVKRVAVAIVSPCRPCPTNNGVRTEGYGTSLAYFGGMKSDVNPGAVSPFLVESMSTFMMAFHSSADAKTTAAQTTIVNIGDGANNIFFATFRVEGPRRFF